MIFKLPAYYPQIPEGIALENPLKLKIESFSLFGKKDNNTDVSTTSDQLEGTGVRFQPNAIVRITKLRPNEKYSFAVAAYDAEENISNTIGVTLKNVHSSQPLPIALIYGYLCKIAYQISDMSIALKAAQECCKFLIEKQDMKEKVLDFEQNPLLTYRIKSDKVRDFSCLEMRSVAESLMIWSYCLESEISTKKVSTITKKITKVQYQTEVLTICNLYLLAIELCIPSESWDLSKRVMFEMFNILTDFFNEKTQSKILLQILIKMHLCISLIPENYWDDNLRKLSAKLSYQAIKLSVRCDEFLLSKRILYQDIKVSRRKYCIIPEIKMIEYVDPNLKKGKNVPKKEPVAKGGKKAEQVVEVADTPKLIPDFTRQMIPCQSYQPYFEEFLFSLHEEYFNFVEYFTEYWGEHLSKLEDQVIGEEALQIIDSESQKMNQMIEFQQMFFDMDNMMQKLESGEQASSKFLEYICKFVKRIVDLGSDPQQIYNHFKHIQLSVNPEEAGKKAPAAKKPAPVGGKGIAEPINENLEEENLKIILRKPMKDELEFASDLMNLKFSAYENNIQWNPSALQFLVS